MSPVEIHFDGNKESLLNDGEYVDIVHPYLSGVFGCRVRYISDLLPWVFIAQPGTERMMTEKLATIGASTLFNLVFQDPNNIFRASPHMP